MKSKDKVFVYGQRHRQHQRRKRRRLAYNNSYPKIYVPANSKLIEMILVCVFLFFNGLKAHLACANRILLIEHDLITDSSSYTYDKDNDEIIIDTNNEGSQQPHNNLHESGKQRYCCTKADM